VPQAQFDLTVPKIALVGNTRYIVELSDSETGAIARIDNALNALSEKHQNTINMNNESS
jgi:hypothetical protein